MSRSSSYAEGMYSQHRQNSQSFSGRVRNLANMSKPVISILLSASDDSQSCPRSFIPTFSTRDKIEGTVFLTATHDTPFDELEISFGGSVKTHVDRIGTVSAVNSRTEAFHQFLKLTQPMEEDQYPSPRIAVAGQTYSFPFTFVVPDELLPTSCVHKKNNTKIEDAHLQLPPSLGDPDLAGTSTQLRDDMAPGMVRVSYSIKARLMRNRLRDGKESIVSDKIRKIRIVPATLEQPPVDIDGQEDEYTLRKEKSIRKGIFKSKAGRMVAEVSQPRSLHLAAPENERNSSVDGSSKEIITTMASIMLRYDPVDGDSQPLRLGSLNSKLRVFTYFSSVPLRDFPSKARLVYEINQGVHMETLSLSSRCMENVQWTRHEPGTDPQSINYRRGSTLSMGSFEVGSETCPQPTKNYDSNKPFYTAQVVVPIALPSSKSFVPTFHSCLVSRVYIAEFTLSVPSQSSGAGVPTTLTLKVPIQITSDSQESSRRSSATGASSVNDQEQAMLEQGNINEYFMPRSIAPPPPQFLERGRIASLAQSSNGDTSAHSRTDDLPPEYSYVAPPNAGIVPVCG